MKHQEIIEKMTLEEKASMMSGKGFWDTVDIPRLSIPSLRMSDGPHGIRKQAGNADHLGLNASVPATCFPTAAAMANTWNPVVAEIVGKNLGEEATTQQVDVLLGPGLNIKRSPLCGRNFEYFSEDPYLSGKMAAGYIRGIQGEGIIACPKHFAVNSQELRRMSNDSIVDERTLREIYTTGFEIAVREGKPKAIMSAYNKVNGSFANENRHLLKDILRDDFGFEGIVISDWGGSNDHVAGVKAGSHLEMPTTGNDGRRILANAVKNGELSEEELDRRVDELLDVILWRQEHRKTDITENFDVEKHHAVAKWAAEESIVLLKNEDHILPLKPTTKVCVFGEQAFHARFQGAGSSAVNPTKTEQPIDAWERADVKLLGAMDGYTAQAQTLAQNADVVVVYIGLDEIEESEGKDREHLRLNNGQIEMLEKLAETNSNIVVVLTAGCVVEMPWLSKVKALVHGYLPGQAGAEAVVDVLMGKVCPSGKLAETYPLYLEDTPCFHYYPGREKTSEYREGLYVGYRYYETVKKPVQFPFGFGLSYTEFIYESCKVTQNGVTVKIRNSGSCDGAEIVQMYIAKEDSNIFRPARELKGFRKVYLKAGECAEISIPFEEVTFRYFNVGTNRWETESGTYRILIGSSVRDIRLQESIEIRGTNAEMPYKKEKLLPYYNGKVEEVDDESFRELLGHEIPESSWRMTAPLGLNDTVSQMFYAKSRIARCVYHVIRYLKDRSIRKGKPDLNLFFIYDIPFRGIAKMMGGAVTMEMVEAILLMINGKFGKGFKALIRAAAHNRQ